MGCGASDGPRFRLNLEGREAQEVSLLQREAIGETLEAMFGTPDEPAVPEEVDLDLDLLRMAAGPVARYEDERGRPVRQRGLFRRHCAACHGIAGDGAGPLAMAMDPYPRDFRNGVFKFTSTRAGAKPTRDDLERVLLRGIPWTGMPSFVARGREEIDALVEYVKYLSIRGETELYLIALVVDEDEYLPLRADAKEMVLEEGAQWAAESWALPEEYPDEYVVVPPPMPPTDTPEQLAKSIALGYDLYASKDAQCAKCHGLDGAGDGEESELYDDWNKPKVGVTPEQTRQLAGRYTLPVLRLRARDFREGVFLGGSRPEDLYWRIHVGIKGTPMPATGPAPGVLGALTEEEIWHVVNYVRSCGER